MILCEKSDNYLQNIFWLFLNIFDMTSCRLPLPEYSVDGENIFPGLKFLGSQSSQNRPHCPSPQSNNP